MENIKVSVVVPVYNAEVYLADCINSIIRQTYRNFELLMIIDGATDKSAEICREFSEKDPRIIVVEKPNEGVSATRNRGLSLACGEYVCFIDADDRVTDDYLEKLLKCALDNGAQMVLCQYAFERGENFFYSGEPVFPTYNKETDSLYEKYIRSLYRIDSAAYIMGSACRSLFMREMLLENKIVFPPCKLYEDQLFVLSAMAASDKIAAVNEAMYFYNDDVSGSAVRKPYKLNLLQDQQTYLENLRLRLEILPITVQERQTVWQYALLNVRKFLLTNAAMNPSAAYRRAEIKEIRASKVFEEKVPLNIYRKWLMAQPVKTQIAEGLLLLRLYTLLRILRSR